MAKQAQVPLAAVIKPLARLPPEEVSQGRGQGTMRGRRGGEHGSLLDMILVVQMVYLGKRIFSSFLCKGLWSR